ncbi:unnamed protein product, partial [Staurois parvus]
MPIIATDQCPSMPNISAHQSCLSVPISDACQCPSVPHHQCSLFVPISVTYQCQSVLPICAHHCRLSVPVS